MQSKSYALLLVEYLQEQATDHLDRRRAAELMRKALQRGRQFRNMICCQPGPQSRGKIEC